MNPLQPFSPFPLPTDLRATLFPPTSRYHGVELRSLFEPSGREIKYLARRFVPMQDRFETIHEHVVTEGDRLDNLAFKYFNDPEQFWRIADANNELNPFELTAVPGRKIRITLPEGVAGAPLDA